VEVIPICRAPSAEEERDVDGEVAFGCPPLRLRFPLIASFYLLTFGSHVAGWKATVTSRPINVLGGFRFSRERYCHSSNGNSVESISQVLPVDCQ
jgi:hypothetical protein